ncbi:TonB-dependent receptor [Luteimonas sp. 8-5]|uniref:TonB-dependent receptor n=1 Tax=Luteimonas sp. 8-5 TaxID=3039387 RepID=UPI002436CE61|nr:TonB-dependent receptor [Luteimonas sp. 8-5]MDG6347418.1 TonB-dependent receptor [Luteimonas sp. 8-5]
MTHRNRARLSKLSLALIVALAASPAFAQSTSAGVGGQVVGADGAPVAGAEVVITHTESGTVSRAVTDESGRYNARGLRVGGPYTITVTKAGTGTDTEENVYLSLNQVAQINAQLGEADATTFASVTVTGSALSDVFSSANKGVGTSVDGRKMEIMPQSNRSVDDVARLDPRITVIDQASGAISVAGINNRFNDISVDGMSQGDPFGLNSNGMPYTGSPISVDAIAAYDIKVSDFDVSSDTVGATVNAVTKSGTNEFHGSLYYVLKDSDWVGKRDGEEYGLFGQDETKGFSVGGPIVKDKLFFYALYEEQEVSDFGGATPADGVASGVISLDEVNEAIRIANQMGMQENEYGALDSVLTNKRYLGKIDWNISDNHRASLTYQQTEEARPQPYDLRSDSVILTNHWYFTDNVTKNTSVQLFSDWTTNFSTEVKVSKQTFDQVNGAFVKNTEVQVRVPGGSIFIGEDDNRHENQINTDRITATVSGTYYAGDHTIKGGFDYLRHDVFNLYGKTLHGEYIFDSLADFEAGNYDRYVIRRPAAGYTEADTAAALVYEQVSPFLQDTWQVNDNLSVVYGVRVNIPKAKDAPEVAPGYEEAFGFTNAYKLGSSNKLVLPRVAFNYTFDTERYSQLRGGIGSFQSVPPFVWLANPYQNNGVTAVRYQVTDPSLAPFSPDPYNQPLPAGVTPGNLVCGEAGVTCQVDALDPDFKLPSVWKISLGYDAELPWMGLIGTVELQSIKSRDAVFYQANNLGEVQGQLADGRDYYYCTLGSLSTGNKNCDRHPAFAFNSTLLGNTDKGASNSLTVALDKPMSNGWYANLSYTYTDADEVASDGSSQAFSSYQFVSRVNPNQEIATNAGRLIRNSVKLSLGWEHAFFGDYKTSVTAFYNGHDGLPYTWTYNGDPNGDGIFQDPAYIPMVNDPIVSYGSATQAQIDAFHAFIESDKYLRLRRGQIAERNQGFYPWVNQLDVGIQQELPGFFNDNKTIVRLDIYNFLNLLNKDWGHTKGDTFSDNTRQLARLGGINPDGTYVYDLGSVNNPSYQDLEIYDSYSGFPSRLVSRWSAMLTVRYEF